MADHAPAGVEARLTARGEPLRPRVRDLYTIQLRLHILPALGSTRLARLITAEVRAWYANLRGPDGPGASTAAKCYRLVRSILTTAVEDGLISANPAPSRALASSPPTNDRSPPWPRPTISPPPSTRGCGAPPPRRLRRTPQGRTPRLSTLATSTSTATKSPSSSSASSTATATTSSAHRRRRRTLAIPAALVDDLRDHLDAYAQPGADVYVFTGHKGGPLAPHVLQEAWAKARAEVSLPSLHLHDLRHLAGTLVASTGAGTKVLMYRLGHASHQAALRYQHATQDRDRAIADALDCLIADPQRALD